MKTTKRMGFTLIDLLIVVSIVGLLMAVALPVTTSVIKKTRVVETKASIMWLKSAIASYESEYGKLPTNATGGDVDVDTDGADPIVFVLLGQTRDGLNTRGVNFFNGKVAIGKRNGITLDATTAALHDAWGQPVHVLLDADGDHLLKNPDVANADASISGGATARLPASVAVFSNGPDGKANTGDDVVTWR